MNHETAVSNANEIVDHILAPAARQNDRDARFSSEAVAALGPAGLLGIMLPTEVGGSDLGPRTFAAVVAALAEADASAAMVYLMHTSATATIAAARPGATVAQTLRHISAGKHLTTLAFSEAGSRSHFWAPVSTARPDGDRVVLDAQKSFATSASRASAYVWSSKPLQPDSGLSTLWLVPADSPGIRVHGPFNGLGLRGNDSSPISADGTSIPATAMLGEDGKGFDIMMGTVLPMFNVLSAACSVGLMEAAVQRTALHASAARYAHLDAKLADLPTIRSYIARMRIRADMARTLLDDTIAALETGRADTMLRVLSCKAAAGDAALEVLDTAMRVCGGAAFRKDLALERYFRDGQAASVMGPTTDVLYDFVGKAVCGMNLF